MLKFQQLLNLVNEHSKNAMKVDPKDFPYIKDLKKIGLDRDIKDIYMDDNSYSVRLKKYIFLDKEDIKDLIKIDDFNYIFPHLDNNIALIFKV